MFTQWELATRGAYSIVTKSLTNRIGLVLGLWRGCIGFMVDLWWTCRASLGQISFDFTLKILLKKLSSSLLYMLELNSHVNESTLSECDVYSGPQTDFAFTFIVYVWCTNSTKPGMNNRGPHGWTPRQSVAYVCIVFPTSPKTNVTVWNYSSCWLRLESEIIPLKGPGNNQLVEARRTRHHFIL